MTIAWPAGCPSSPLLRSYSEAPRPNVIRTEMDQGPVKVRRVSTASVTDYSLAFLMTGSELSTFITFFKITTNEGSLPFQYTHPRTKTLDGRERWRFAQPPTWVPLSTGLWEVSVMLEELP
jgi:hypothetical protein